MIPLWMNLLGYQFLRDYDGSTVLVPYHKIISSLLTLIIPLLIGIGLAKWNPGFGVKARKVSLTFTTWKNNVVGLDSSPFYHICCDISRCVRYGYEYVYVSIDDMACAHFVSL